MDPEAVIEEARGSIDEALLTRTGGGFLGRSVLADEPLVAHLDDAETLQYLLAGPAPPTKVEDGRETALETTGSYRTLLAVTDERLLVVAGSADGDRGVSLPYDTLTDVDLRMGMLTDTVVVDTAAGTTWTVSVGAGSDAGAAVAYASERLPADVSSAGGESDGFDPLEQPSTTGTVADASTEPSAVGGAEDDHPEAGEADVTELPPESPLVAELFDVVVGADDVPRVEGYGEGQADDLLKDLAAHRDRVYDRLDDGDLDAALGAAATVDAVAAEGERLADRRGDGEFRRSVVGVRRAVRRAVVGAALDDVDVGALDGDPIEGVTHLLRGVDPDAFEQFVADLWSGMGYQTAVTQSSKDRGVDVVARQSTPVEQTVVIQAKRYGPNTKVGREAVQQYASLHRQERDADLVVVVTTGAFTGPAREAAKDLNVKLVDGDRLAEMVVERERLDLVVRHAAG